MTSRQNSPWALDSSDLRANHTCALFAPLTAITQLLGVGVSSRAFGREPSAPYPSLPSSSHAASLFLPKWAHESADVSIWLCLLGPRSSLPLEQRVKNIILKHTYRSLCQSCCMAEDTPDAPKASYLGISSHTVCSTSALIYWIWHWKDWTSGPSDKMILIRVSKALTCNKPWVKCYELMTTDINNFY